MRSGIHLAHARLGTVKACQCISIDSHGCTQCAEVAGAAVSAQSCRRLQSCLHHDSIRRCVLRCACYVCLALVPMHIQVYAYAAGTSNARPFSDKTCEKRTATKLRRQEKVRNPCSRQVRTTCWHITHATRLDSVIRTVSDEGQKAAEVLASAFGYLRTARGSGLPTRRAPRQGQASRCLLCSCLSSSHLYGRPLIGRESRQLRLA